MLPLCLCKAGAGRGEVLSGLHTADGAESKPEWKNINNALLQAGWISKVGLVFRKH